MQASRLESCSVTKAARESHLVVHDVWATNFDALDIEEQLSRIEGNDEQEMLVSFVQQNGLQHAMRVVFGEIDHLQKYTAVYSASVLLFMATLVTHQTKCGRKIALLGLFTPVVAVKLAGLEFRLRRHLKRLAGTTGLPTDMVIEIMPPDAPRVWNSNLVDCVFATEVVLLSPQYCQEVAMEHMLALLHMSKDNSFVGFGVFSRLLAPQQCAATTVKRARSRRTARAPAESIAAPTHVQATRAHSAAARWKRAIRAQIKQNRMDRTRTAMNRVESRRRQLARSQRRAATAHFPLPISVSPPSRPAQKKKAKLAARAHGVNLAAKTAARKLIARETLLDQAEKKRREKARQDAIWHEKLRCLRIGDDIVQG